MNKAFSCFHQISIRMKSGLTFPTVKNLFDLTGRNCLLQSSQAIKNLATSPMVHSNFILMIRFFFVIFQTPDINMKLKKVTNISVVFQDVRRLNTSKKVQKNIVDGDSHFNVTTLQNKRVGLNLERNSTSLFKTQKCS